MKLSKRLLCDLRDLHLAQPAIRTYRGTRPLSIRAFRAHASPTRLARMEELANPRSRPTLTTDSSPHRLCAASWAHHNARTALAQHFATLPAAPPTQPPIRALPPHTSSGSEQEEEEEKEEEEEEEVHEEPQSPPDIPFH